VTICAVTDCEPERRQLWDVDGAFHPTCAGAAPPTSRTLHYRATVLVRGLATM
jgi:hypothetical protein